MGPATQTLIRPARIADARGIAQVHVASWRESYAGLLPEAMLAGLSVAARERNWSAMLERPSAFALTAVFVAERESGIVGFAAGGPQRDAGLAAQGFDAEIGSIYLLRHCQRGGIGTALLRALFAALAGSGFGAASLWVLRGNAAACRFYERLGGSPVGEKTERRGDNVLAERAYGWRGLTLAA